MSTYDRDVREEIERMERNDPLHPIRKNAFMFVGMLDWLVSSIVWTAAYDKARSGGVVGIEAIDEEAAVRHADSIVRQTQSAGLPQDLPALMRDNQIMKLMTMFFSYFSVLYNWTAYDQVMNLRKGRLPPHVFIGNLALIFIISPLIAEFLGGRFFPRDDETEEERNQRLMWTLIRYPAMTLPFVRNVAQVAGSAYDFTLSPTESAIGQIIDAGEDIAAGRTFESEATTKRFVTAIGYLYGLPTPQIWITLDYLFDKLEGEEPEGFDPVEAFIRDSR
jgi:hypothetical protein